MKLTSRSEYALLAMLYLARHHSEKHIAVQTIAAAQGIPPKFLQQILQTLRLARYLDSSKGKDGGFRLARSPDKISLAEIIRLFNGLLAPSKSVSKYFYESTPIEQEGTLLALFKEMRDYICDKLENTTLADVCGNSPAPGISEVKTLSRRPD